MQVSKRLRRFRHWLLFPVLVTGNIAVPAVQQDAADLLGGTLPMDDGSGDDGGEIGALVVNASSGPTDDITAAVSDKGQQSTATFNASAPVSINAAQFLGSTNKNSISLFKDAITTTTQAPAASKGTGEDNDRVLEETVKDDSDRALDEAVSGGNQHPTEGIVEQLLRVQLASVKQENEALHAALSHSTASAASLDKELAEAENKRAEAEFYMRDAMNETKKEHAAYEAIAAKFRALEAQRIAELKRILSEKHSLQVNLSNTQNYTVALQDRLQVAIDSGKAAISTATKQEAALTAGLKKARVGEVTYHNDVVALEKNVGRLRQANAHLHTLLRQRVQQLRKSENLRLRAEGALSNAEKAVTKLSKRSGSEPWFEEQVATLRAAAENATHEAKFARESRDAEQSLLESANRDRETLKGNLAAMNKSDAQHIHWLTAALAESKAQAEQEKGNESRAWQVVTQLQSDLKIEEKRRESAEGAAQQAVNRSAVVKHFADTEVQRAAKEADDAELAAGKAVTRAASAESQVGELNQELQAVKAERDELKSSQKQEEQSANDLADEVKRLRTQLADSNDRLSRSEQHAATLQAQFNAVGDLGVPAASAVGKKHGNRDAKKKSSRRDRMRRSLSLIESNDDVFFFKSASPQPQEHDDKDEGPDHAAIMKGDADRLQALLS